MPKGKTRSGSVSVSVVNRSGMVLSSRIWRRFLETRVAELRRKKLWPSKLRFLTLVFVNRLESRRLNAMRGGAGRSRPANILSFDYGIEGELVLCPSVVRIEARDENEPFEDRIKYLFIHGLVHLTGLHHESSRAHERQARALERTLLREAGIRAGL